MFNHKNLVEMKKIIIVIGILSVIFRANAKGNNEMVSNLADSYATGIEAEYQFIEIQGLDYICTDDTIDFSLSDIPENVVSYSWTTYDAAMMGSLNIVQGQGTPSIRVVFEEFHGVTVSSRMGNIPSINPIFRTNVSVTITMSDSTTYTIEKPLHASRGAVPVIEASSTELPWRSGTTRRFYMTNNTEAPFDSLHWELVDVVFRGVGNVNDTTIIRGNGSFISYTPRLQPGYIGLVTITATNTFETCGEEQSTTLTIGTGHPNLSLVAINAGNVLNVSVVENNEDQRSLFQLNERSSYTLEMWNDIDGCVHTQTMLSNNEQINISGFKRGVYVLVLKENGNVATQAKVQI